MIYEVRIVMLAELDPTGAAGCEHRHCALVLDPLDKLVSLLNDSKVSSYVHVEALNIAEALDSRNHLALNVCADRIAELLAESSSDRRSCKEHYLLVGISNSLPYLILAALLLECACRTSYDTLTAANAGRYES